MRITQEPEPADFKIVDIFQNRMMAAYVIRFFKLSDLPVLAKLYFK